MHARFSLVSAFGQRKRVNWQGTPSIYCQMSTMIHALLSDTVSVAGTTSNPSLSTPHVLHMLDAISKSLCMVAMIPRE
jgi:hypothetical protein